MDELIHHHSLIEALPFLACAEVDYRLQALRDTQFGEVRAAADWEAVRDRVVDAALLLPEWTIEELMPFAPYSDVAHLPIQALDTRSSNILASAGIMTWEDLRGLTIINLRSMPGAGTASVRRIVTMAVECAAGPPREAADIWEAIKYIAAWASRERDAFDLGSLLQFDPTLTIPDDVRGHYSTVASIPLTAIADRELSDSGIDELMQRFLHEFDERVRTVLTHRTLATNPKTLAAVGDILGVTRARVGQIQQGLLVRISEVVDRCEYAPLRWRAADLATRLGTFAPADAERTVIALNAAQEGCAPERREALTQLLLLIGGPYRAGGGWLCRSEGELPTAADLMKAMGDRGICGSHDASEWLSMAGLDKADLAAWVDSMESLRILGDFIAVWDGSVVDKAVAILGMRGEPADAEMLVREIGEGHSVRGSRQRFFDDLRLIRVDKSRWALREWGLEEYTGIVDEIEQRIRAGGGRVSVDVLVEELVKNFDVSASSVRVYVEAPLFVNEAGFVRLRRADETYVVDGDVASEPGLFIIDGSRVSCILRVDSEILRGSGRVCPQPLASLLGINPGGRRIFISPAGSRLTMSWPVSSANGPAFGSTRALVTEVGAIAGDRIRLEFDNDTESVTPRRVRDKELESIGPAERLAALSGIEEAHDMRAALANALGVEKESVEQALRKRGESQIADLIPPPETDSDLDAAVAEFARLLGN